MTGKSIEEKKDVLRKYALGVEEVWKRLVDQGPEMGDPLELFDQSIQLCEVSLENLLR